MIQDPVTLQPKENKTLLDKYVKLHKDIQGQWPNIMTRIQLNCVKIINDSCHGLLADKHKCNINQTQYSCKWLLLDSIWSMWNLLKHFCLGRFNFTRLLIQTVLLTMRLKSLFYIFCFRSAYCSYVLHVFGFAKLLHD